MYPVPTTNHGDPTRNPGSRYLPAKQWSGLLEATDAEEAWRLMEENWVQVVVSDQRMPGRTGVELLSDVRDRWPETVRIIITGYASLETALTALELDAFDYVLKPLNKS